jgi:hypothetical protein
MCGMSSLPRPRQVTFAAGLIIGGSVLLVLTAFDQVAGLRSLESQESARRFLSEPPGEGLGLSVDRVLTMLRVLAMTAAACAAAMAILGGYVLNRSHSARLALSVLAVPLVVSGLAAGGVFAPVVAVSVVMLWLQPSRDWFDGIAPRPQPTAERPAAPVAPPSYPTGPTGPTPSSEPRPYTGFGTSPATQPYGVAYGPAAPARRPAAVLWACVLTWTFSGIVAVGMVLSAIVIVVSPDLVLDELRRQEPSLAEDVSEDLLIGTTIAMAAGIVLWCAAAAVVAWFAFKRATWAQITLLCSAGIAAMICLLGTLVGSFPLVIIVAGCAGTASMLLRPEVRQWYAAR